MSLVNEPLLQRFREQVNYSPSVCSEDEPEQAAEISAGERVRPASLGEKGIKCR